MILILLQMTCSVLVLRCATVPTVIAFSYKLFPFFFFSFSGQTIQSLDVDTMEHFSFSDLTSLNSSKKKTKKKTLVKNVIHSNSSHLQGCGGLAKWSLSTNEKHTFHRFLVNLNIYTSLCCRVGHSRQLVLISQAFLCVWKVSANGFEDARLWSVIKTISEMYVI